MAFHRDQKDDSIHSLTAVTYADIAARDADAAFQVTANINKMVRINSPVSYFILVSLSPTVWRESSSTGLDEFIELIDTPSDYTGQAGKVTQVNSGETALEFGQDLRSTGDPTFNNLILTGGLTAAGVIAFNDNNIVIGNVPIPTDVTADGGGITLKGTIDKTILWINATNAWTFNQNLDLLGNNLLTSGAIIPGRAIIDNLDLDGNTLSTLSGDLDITTFTGGVFKYTNNAFQSGQDSSNYLEIGHGGSNSFVNQVGVGGMDFRFGGTTKATFTSAGHLHLLTDTDQKHTLKIITANNLNDTGIAWENSGGSFTHTIFRTDVGSNRADLVFAAGLNTDIDLLTNSFKIHGEASDAGKLEILNTFQISSGAPGLNKVLTSDAIGIATWEPLQSQGWTDDGTVVRLTTSTDQVVIGADTSFGAKLEVVGDNPGNVGGFPSGGLQIRGPGTTANSNAVITGHNSFNGNTQLWYLGSTSSSNQNIALINRQNAELHLHTNDLNRLTIQAGGNVGIGLTNPTEKLDVNGNVQATGTLKCTTVLDNTIYAQLNSSIDQNPTVTTPVVITYNTQDAIAGLTHSTTVNPGEITIDTAGIYLVSPQPQVGKTSGGAKVAFDMFLQVDRGSGFVDEDNSNIKLTIKDADITDVIVSAFTIDLSLGDKIRMMQRVSSSSVGMGLKNTDPEVGPPTVPRTPSIIFTMYRVGGI